MSFFSSSREDMDHMKQIHGFKAIKHSDDESVLDQKPPPKWNKPAEKIETPSNNRPSRNPYSTQNYNNIHETRAFAPSSLLIQSAIPSGSRSNPSSNTVVRSRYFPPSNSSSSVNTHRTFRNRTEPIHHDTRPSKKRRTESGSIVTSKSPSNDANFSTSDSWKTETIRVPPMRSLKSFPPVIDLDNEDVRETLLSSPLTPTESSDDIALRSKNRRWYSPPLTEGIGNSLRPTPFKDGMASRNSSTGTDRNFVRKQGPALPFPDVSYTIALRNRHQEDPIENADEFDSLSLEDDLHKGGKSKSPTRSEIPENLVKKSVKHIEALSSASKNNPPRIDLDREVKKKKGLVNGMKAKKSEGLRVTTIVDHPPVPKPPLKVNDVISTTNFTRSEGSERRKFCVPLLEYIYKEQLFKATDDSPYSACFSEDTISIIYKADADLPVLELSSPFLGRLMCPRHVPDLMSEPIVIFRFGSSDVGAADCLGLKFDLAGHNSNRLSSLYNSLLQIAQGRTEFISKGTLPKIWITILQSNQHQTDDSINDSSISIGSSTKKPKPRIIQRTTRNAAARNNLDMGIPSGYMDRVRRSTSPSYEELLLVYPPSGTGALNITYGDIKRLEPGEFLNDTLIEFGLKSWLSDFRNHSPELANQVHVFSSFFYTQLRHKNLEEGYQSVRKWTSRVDIFKKNYIIVPINEHLHWYLAIICYPGRILQCNTQTNPDNFRRCKVHEAVHPATPSSDSMITAQEEREVEMQTSANVASGERIDVPSGSFSPITGSPEPARSMTRSASLDSDELVLDIPDTMDVDNTPEDITAEPTSSEMPHIFTFDSLGSRHVNVLKTLNSYLQLEAKDKKDFVVSMNAYTGQALVPTQPNSCDCGIYLLHFVEQFMSDPERHVNQILHKPPKKSWSIVKSEREQLWNADKVAGKREALKQKLLSLSTEWKHSRKPEAKGKEKGKEKEEVQPSGPSTRSDDGDSDIEVLEITPAPSTTKTSKPSKQKAQRLR